MQPVFDEGTEQTFNDSIRTADTHSTRRTESALWCCYITSDQGSFIPFRAAAKCVYRIAKHQHFHNISYCHRQLPPHLLK